MKKTKTQKGITLVALIITIVVLLILAAVAIGAVKDSNIIGYAQNAAGLYNQAKNNEVSIIKKYEEEIGKHIQKETVGAIVYGTAEEYVIINGSKAIYHYDGEVPQEYEVVRYEENKGQYTILDSNGIDYDQFIIGKYNGYDVPIAALSNLGNNIHRMNNYNKELTGFGFTQSSLELNPDTTIAKNIFKEDPKTRIYEMKMDNGEESAGIYYIIRPNGTCREISIANGQFYNESKYDIEIKEYHTINLYDKLNIGTYRYVGVAKSGSSTGGGFRISADGKSLYDIFSSEIRR